MFKDPLRNWNPAAGTEDGKRRQRGPLILIASLVVAYGLYSLLTSDRVTWVDLEPAAFPAEVGAIQFKGRTFDAAHPHVLKQKRRGKRRKEPPGELTVAFAGKPVARYLCRRPGRCPWIQITGLTCRFDKLPATACRLDLSERVASATKMLPMPRCRLVLPGERDIRIKCPSSLVLGARVAK